MNRTSMLIAAIAAAVMLSVPIWIGQPSPAVHPRNHPVIQYTPLDMKVVSQGFLPTGKQKICVILRSYVPDQLIQLSAMTLDQMISEDLAGRTYERTASGILIGSGSSVNLVILGVGNMQQCLLYTYPKDGQVGQSANVSATTQEGYRLIQTLAGAGPL